MSEHHRVFRWVLSPENWGEVHVVGNSVAILRRALSELIIIQRIVESLLAEAVAREKAGG